jgi:uncharacterized protein (DUF2236 family)
MAAHVISTAAVPPASRFAVTDVPESAPPRRAPAIADMNVAEWKVLIGFRSLLAGAPGAVQSVHPTTYSE